MKGFTSDQLLGLEMPHGTSLRGTLIQTKTKIPREGHGPPKPSPQNLRDEILTNCKATPHTSDQSSPSSVGHTSAGGPSGGGFHCKQGDSDTPPTPSLLSISSDLTLCLGNRAGGIPHAALTITPP